MNKKHFLTLFAAVICSALLISPQIILGEPDAGSSDADPGSKVASASEMADVIDVVEEWMVPVAADELNDGTYDIVMSASSSMFKADHVQLVVENGQMNAVLYMTSKAYLYLYAGTAEEAAAADEAEYIPLVREDDEIGTFTLPVNALDEGTACSAYSKKRGKWYDRTLVFNAGSLPVEAFKESPYETPASLHLEDGAYTAEVTLEGGSGRASVQSPALLTVRDGACFARLTWSSKKYDYMMVDGTRYDPISTEEGSAFEIPVVGFDYPISVQADTTAMSQPYLIDYTLQFDSASITPAS